jgi:hypothetical protein
MIVYICSYGGASIHVAADVFTVYIYLPKCCVCVYDGIDACVRALACMQHMQVYVYTLYGFNVCVIHILNQLSI